MCTCSCKSFEQDSHPLGIETRGIDRIPEEEKQPPSLLNAFLLWWSLNVHIGVVPLGLLGAEFGLDLKQSISAAVAGTMVGALCTAFTGTIGPKVGSLCRDDTKDLVVIGIDLCNLAWSASNCLLTLLFRILG